MNIYEWFYDLLPTFVRFRCCCRKMEKLKEFELVRERLTHEINIVEIVKSRRLIQAAIKLLLSKERHSKMLKNVQY